MQTVTDIAPFVALAALALALLLLVWLILFWRNIRRIRRAQTVVMGYEEERDVVALVSQLDDQVRNLRDAVAILTSELESYNRQLNCALTNCALVRYNAFRDLGGHQSASVALLDNYRSGIVVSAIAARDFSRFYVKHVHEGVADRELAPEEKEAVLAAVPKPLRRGMERQQRGQSSPTLNAKPTDDAHPPAATAAATAAAATTAAATTAAAQAFEALADFADLAAPSSVAEAPLRGVRDDSEPDAEEPST